MSSRSRCPQVTLSPGGLTTVGGSAPWMAASGCGHPPDRQGLPGNVTERPRLPCLRVALSPPPLVCLGCPCHHSGPGAWLHLLAGMSENLGTHSKHPAPTRSPEATSPSGSRHFAWFRTGPVHWRSRPAPSTRSSRPLGLSPPALLRASPDGAGEVTVSVGRSPRAAQWCPPGHAPGAQPLVPVAPSLGPASAPPAWARPA